MEKIEKKLITKFLKIAEKGYIKGINNSDNSVGLTFEDELGKSPDSSFLPDYKNIEIKCKTRFSRFPISLFAKSFDGPTDFEMRRLLLTYGKPDSEFKSKYLLQGNVYANKMTLIYENYFQFDVNRKDKKIYLLIYDKNKNIIEKISYVNFYSLKKRILAKLTNLCFVCASKKKEYGNLFFRYYKISIYRIKSFEKFLCLLEDGKISINLCGRVARSGERIGRQQNKNMVFKIPRYYISELFDKKFEFDYDKYIARNKKCFNNHIFKKTTLPN